MDIRLCNCSSSAFHAVMVGTSSSAGRWPAVMNVFAFQAKVSRWIEGFHCDEYFCIRGYFWLEKPNFHNRRIYSAVWIGNYHPAWKAEHLFATKAQKQEVGFSLFAGVDIHLPNCSGSAFQAAMVGTSSSAGWWPAVMKVIAFQAKAALLSKESDTSFFRMFPAWKAEFS